MERRPMQITPLLDCALNSKASQLLSETKSTLENNLFRSYDVYLAKKQQRNTFWTPPKGQVLKKASPLLKKNQEKLKRIQNENVSFKAKGASPQDTTSQLFEAVAAECLTCGILETEQLPYFKKLSGILKTTISQATIKDGQKMKPLLVASVALVLNVLNVDPANIASILHLSPNKFERLRLTKSKTYLALRAKLVAQLAA